MAIPSAIPDRLLVLDVGALMGSLVGQTEERTRQALKIADAMSPCIEWHEEFA